MRTCNNDDNTVGKSTWRGARICSRVLELNVFYGQPVFGGFFFRYIRPTFKRIFENKFDLNITLVIVKIDIVT